MSLDQLGLDSVHALSKLSRERRSHMDPVKPQKGQAAGAAVAAVGGVVAAFVDPEIGTLVTTIGAALLSFFHFVH